MTSSPSRGLLYPTLPEYDVFKTRPENGVDEDESAAESDADAEDATPMQTRANWTGTVPADD